MGTSGVIRQWAAPWMVLALLLSGCGVVEPYQLSRGPDANGELVRRAIKTTFSESRLAGTPMISPIYPANPVSRGDWLVCLRGSNSPASDTYSMYFTGYTFVAAQRSVLVDRCNEQRYVLYLTPLDDPQPQSAKAAGASPLRVSGPRSP